MIHTGFLRYIFEMIHTGLEMIHRYILEMIHTGFLRDDSARSEYLDADGLGEWTLIVCN